MNSTLPPPLYFFCNFKGRRANAIQFRQNWQNVFDIVQINIISEGTQHLNTVRGGEQNL